jgi:hypothetical protein
LQEFRPERLRLKAETSLPTEAFWACNGHNIHRSLPQPKLTRQDDSPPRRGHNGRQMTLILGKWLDSGC